MNRFSLPKQLTFVFFVVATLASSVGIGEMTSDQIQAKIDACAKQGKTTDEVRAGTAGDIVAMKCANDPDLSSKISECRSMKKDLNSNVEQFMSFCRGMPDSEDGPVLTGNDRKSITECSNKLSECSKGQTSGADFSGMASMFGMSGVSGLMPGSSGTCSKYTQDKLDSLLKEAKRDKKDVEKDLEKVMKDQEKQEKDYLEAKQKIEEDFTKQQEDRAAAELDAKEKKRNDKAALEKRAQEADAQIRAMRREITTLQNKQKLLIEKRRLDVASQAGKMNGAKASCRAKTLKEFEGMNRSGSLGSSQSLKKEKEQSYLACMQDFMNAFEMAGSEFTVAMKDIDDMIVDRSADLEAATKSLESLTKMFQEAEVDFTANETKKEEAFNKRQVATWQKMIESDNQMRQQRINTANSISQAKMNTIQAGNELAKYQGQTAIGDESPGKVQKDYLAKYNGAQSSYDELNCDSVLGVSKSGSSATKTDQAR